MQMAVAWVRCLCVSICLFSRQYWKISPVLCPGLRIHGQLPAAIVNGRGDSFWKQPDFQLWTARDLDLVLGHTSYHRASLVDLYLYSKFHWNRKKLFVDGRTDGRKYVRIYRWTFDLRLALLGPLCRRVDLKTYALRITKLDTGMVHHESVKHIYFGVKRSRSRGIKTLPARVMALLWMLTSSYFMQPHY